MLKHAEGFLKYCGGVLNGYDALFIVLCYHYNHWIEDEFRQISSMSFQGSCSRHFLVPVAFYRTHTPGLTSYQVKN
jgi:hypothetical protein